MYKLCWEGWDDKKDSIAADGWCAVNFVHVRRYHTRFLSPQILLSASHAFIFKPDTSLDFFIICSFISFVSMYLLWISLFLVVESRWYSTGKTKSLLYIAGLYLSYYNSSTVAVRSINLYCWLLSLLHWNDCALLHKPHTYHTKTIIILYYNIIL